MHFNTAIKTVVWLLPVIYRFHTVFMVEYPALSNNVESTGNKANLEVFCSPVVISLINVRIIYSPKRLGCLSCIELEWKPTPLNTKIDNQFKTSAPESLEQLSSM